MKDYELQVLEQYDMTINSTRRTRGAVLCETSKGLFLLKKLTTSPRRIPILERLHQHLKENGYDRVDRFVKNKEMEVISQSEDGEKYVVKEWYGGRECDIRREDEVLSAVRNLAILHKRMQTLQLEEDVTLQAEDLRKVYRRHNQEMKKVRSFIRKRVGKNDFEILYLKYFEAIYSIAQAVTEVLENSRYEMLKKGYIHGDYNYHNLLFCGKEIATTNFEHFQENHQVQDLYYFMRKTLEKNHWNSQMGYKMLEEYEKLSPLGKEEQLQLAISLAYPEKFWKAANSYYRSSKVWLPVKNVEKLETVIRQTEQKKRFLEEIFSFHL